MSLDFLVIGVLIVLSFCHAIVFGGRLPGRYASRACQGRIWRSTFPQAEKYEIREFLQLFAESFAFDSKERLKLSPRDGVLDIYRASYQYEWMADVMELETLGEEFLSKYRIDLGAYWFDSITLGDLFRISRGIEVDV